MFVGNVKDAASSVIPGAMFAHVFVWQTNFLVDALKRHSSQSKRVMLFACDSWMG